MIEVINDGRVTMILRIILANILGMLMIKGIPKYELSSVIERTKCRVFTSEIEWGTWRMGCSTMKVMYVYL